MSPALPDEPRWNERAMLAVHAAGLALLAWSWWRVEGWPLADAVEYMDRARSFVRGEGLGAAHAVRSFAFSLVFVPVFAAAEALGLDDERVAATACRLLQVGLALGLVQAVARLAGRLAGRDAGLAAGWLVVANPAWLLYGAVPVADLAAALCVAHALPELLPRRPDARPDAPPPRPLRGGLWLGAALLVSYKTLPVGAAVLLFQLVAGRRRALAPVGRALAGLGAGAAVQVALDRWVYGTWGVSLGRYVVENVGGVLGRVALELKLDAVAVWIYDLLHELRGWDYGVRGAPPAVRQRMPVDWYVTHLPEMLAVPVLALLALAVVRWVRRPRADVAILGAAFLLNVAVLSTKGSKSFRLWLPLLPLVLPVGAWALAALAAGEGARSLRRAGAVALLAVTLVLGVAARAREPDAVHGGYWRAAEAARALAPEDGSRPVRFASAYPWATFGRAGRGLEWTRLAHPLEAWGGLGVDARDELFDQLGALDAFAVHLAQLTEHPTLFLFVNGRFRVEAAFYDQALHARLGPVFLLVRAERGEGRRFFGTPSLEDLDLDALPPSTRFAAGDEELHLLGWAYEELPPDGPDRHGWITYWWTTPTGLSEDHRFLDRATAPDERNAWQNNHGPQYGVSPTSGWLPGTVMAESYLLVPAAEAMFEGRPWRPVGGAYRRGDLMPLRLWMMVCLPDGEAELRPSLAAVPPGDPGAELARRDQARLRRTPPGYAFSADGLVEVGRLLAPVPPRARVPDDGRPIPADG